MEEQVRIRLKQSQFEIEIEGDKEFVEAQFNKFLEHFDVCASAASEPKEDALEQLLSARKPNSHSDKVLLFAYYLEKHKKLDSFTAEDITRCFEQSRTQEPRNVNDLIRKLPGEYLMEVERKDRKKGWRLTREGMLHVESKR